MTARRTAGLAAALPLVVVVGALAWAATRDDTEPETGGSEPVSRLVGADGRSCATYPLPADVTGTATDIGAVGGARTGAEVEAAEVLSGSVLSTDDGAAWGTATLAAGEAADLVVRGSDAAAGFTARRLPDAAGGGLAVQRCAAPARQWWFVGAGSSPERESTLVLSNLDQTDAVVDVALRGVEGPLETVGTDGVRVGADDTVRLPLGELVAGEEEVAVEVDAAQGRVVAAVADDWSGAVDPLGSEWLPAVAAPSDQVLLPGGADAGPRSRLVVANPETTATPVDVSLVDSDGTFVPSDGETELTVPAGGVAVVAAPTVDRAGEATTYGVLVEAGGPVTAALRVATADDVGYAVAGPVLTEPAVFPVDLGRSLTGSTGTLSLAVPLPAGITAGEVPPPGSATVTAHDEAGEPIAETTADVPAGTVQAVDLDDLELSPTERAETAYLEVARGEGPVTLVGAATWRGPGGLVSVLPLDSGLVRVPLPVVTGAVR